MEIANRSVLAATVAVEMVVLRINREARIVIVMQGAKALGFSLAYLIPCDFAFEVDSRQQLVAFIRQNVSPTATPSRRTNLLTFQIPPIPVMSALGIFWSRRLWFAASPPMSAALTSYAHEAFATSPYPKS
jgi:hypothetical protein